MYKNLLWAFYILAVGVFLLDLSCSSGTPVLKDSIALVDSSKVTVSNFYPGASAEYTIKVQNNYSKVVGIEVSYDKSNTYPPKEWVTGLGKFPVLAGETLQVPIELTMPVDSLPPQNEFKFRLLVNEVSQSGMVQVAYSSDWTVKMR